MTWPWPKGWCIRNAFCTTSLCSPSRASLLSGVYAHSHGVTNNFTEIPADLETFPKALQHAGYATAYVGKYHMGENNDAPRPGFDYFVTHKGQGKYFDTEFNINGTKREVTIAAVVAAMGARNPAAGSGPFRHRQAWIYVSSAGRAADPAAITKLETFRRTFEQFFANATGGRMTLETGLE